jgi:UDP-GlcNAc:undecaprenyl-phosphate/decaprenyl-phosphate GlcNAc-1-phosphate transferase
MTARARLAAGLTGATAATAALQGLSARPPGGAAVWQRTNHRGAPVSLLSGPALAGAAGLAAGALPAAVAAVGGGLVGRYDDVVGARPDQRDSKGLRGHAAALVQGRVTAGAGKVVGLGLTGLAAAALAGRRGTDLLLDGALVAGTANVLNLLDVRPGRALKAGLVAAVVLDEPGVAGAVAALLPADLAERTMLGDAGANALGAVLGTCLAARLRTRTGRGAALAGVVGLTGLSEVVPYSRIIDALPPLRWADRLGRRP